MALPPYDGLRAAALRMIGDGKVHQIQEVIEGVAAELGISDADRARRTPKMRRLKFDIYVERAVADLRKAAWLENTGLGRFRITGEGRAVLSGSPKRIGLGFLRDNSAAFRERDASSRSRGRRGPAGNERGGEDKGDGIVAVIGAHASGNTGADGKGDGPLRLLRYVRELLEEGRLAGLRTAAFSGTLFMTAEGGARRDLLLAFSRAVWPAVTNGIREDVPVSGGVACGRLERPAENWVAGPAASEAAALARGPPSWAGISAAPSADGVLAGAVQRGRGRTPYARHGLPAGGPAGRGAWAVNWPGLCGEADMGEVEELAGIMDDRIESAMGSEAALLWWNTRRFCERALRAS